MSIIHDYYKDKGRDLPSTPSPVSDLLHQLDLAVIEHLNCDGPYAAVKAAFEAVLAHPDSTWTRDVLQYRVRQLHYH